VLADGESYEWGNTLDEAEERWSDNVGGTYSHVGKVAVTFKRERKIPAVKVEMPDEAGEVEAEAA
jgi:hypothetical protein